MKRHLVLVGGGHSHLGALRHLADLPSLPFRVTLISEDRSSAYSGMLPGVISGQYQRHEMNICLQTLVSRIDVTFIQARVIALDTDQRIVTLADGQEITFDLLSLNTGSTPDLQKIPGAAEHALPVKPIGAFLNEIENSLSANAELVIVGNGAAGVEMAFALTANRHIRALQCNITLLGSARTPLPDHAPKAGRLALQQLLKKNVRVIGARVSRISGTALYCEDGSTMRADKTILATGASPPQWLVHAGLPQAESGFFEVNTSLQSSAFPWLFITGDLAEIRHFPRPRSGVFAVRQGPVLGQNLVALQEGTPMTHYLPQNRSLALISTSDGSAIASRGNLAASGRWAGYLKHWIDTRFVNTYRKPL